MINGRWSQNNRRQHFRDVTINLKKINTIQENQIAINKYLIQIWQKFKA